MVGVVRPFPTYNVTSRRALPPVNTVAPVASGTVQIGTSLSCTTGTWTNSPTSYSYQWQRDGVDIPGATSSSYSAVTADIGPVLRCRVTATNSSGSVSAISSTLTYSPNTSLGSALSFLIRGDTGVTLDVSSAVQTWADQSGNGRNVAQSNASNRPTVETINGRSAVRFNGSTQEMTSTPVNMSTFIGSASGNWRVFVVCEPISVGSNNPQGYQNQGPCGGSGGYFYPAAFRNQGSGVYTAINGYFTSADRSVAPSGVSLAPLLVDTWRDGGAGVQVLHSRINAGAEATLSDNGTIGLVTDALLVGKNYLNFFSGRIGIIAIITGTLTSDQANSFRAWCTYLYGVTS